ncbi:MAG: hypothetical protein GY715_02180 [Planctomycetes bacterium]|jgi:nitrogen fixation protein FixH|nr:hypothetical protein [Phycisphaeraceae bacterium]MCP3902417.1 hypothetical protein [Planctomycetota bacterium]MCP4066653.1 hypothetical protein [Phycisphaeraceae bacterium]MCP4495994.1 hypothetical protein [Phycisphaeraceae bacterium]MCP4796772.1 hypothetical protein [Phycisphaeraceae bacterium]
MWANRWMFMPIALIGLCLAMSTITVTLAITNQSMVAEPDYYDEAIRWDERRAQFARNDQLRWRVTPELAAGRLDVSVQDKHGVRIDGAEVDIELIPALRPNDRHRLVARETAPGRYVADWPSGPPGRWEIRTRVVRGEATYTDRCERILRPVSRLGDD